MPPELMISPDEIKGLVSAYSRTSESSLSIIFGAGASYGYSKKIRYAYRPPAVASLLEETDPIVSQIINKSEHRDIKGQRAHIQRSIKGLGNDLEAYLSDIYENDRNDDLFPRMLRYLEDIYYLASYHSDLEDNNYQSLVSRIRDLRGARPWSLISFNYDTLLEQSVASLPRFVPRREFKSDENYLVPNPSFIKMHGGINMRYREVGDDNEESLSLHAAFTRMMSTASPIEEYLSVLDTDMSLPHFESVRYIEGKPRRVYDFPLMMIPVHTKIKNENTFFKRQLGLSRASIEQSKLVIAIGYQFGDETFVSSLSRIDLQETTLILVGSENLLKEGTQSRTYINASKAWPKSQIRIFAQSGFEAFCDALY